MAQPEPQAQQVLRDQQAPQVLRDQQALQDPLAHKVYRAKLDPLAHREFRACRVFRVMWV